KLLRCSQFSRRPLNSTTAVTRVSGSIAQCSSGVWKIRNREGSSIVRGKISIAPKDWRNKGKASISRAIKIKLRLRMLWASRGSQKRAVRSEEHTSELQSRENLVCRLLLEKKK